MQQGKQRIRNVDGIRLAHSPNLRKNLRKLVERLQKTNAKLIWRNTTPVPKGAKGRVVGDSVKYNEIAAKVAEKFVEKFPNHQHAARMAFRVGQSYHKDEDYTKAGESFDEFIKAFPDDDLSPQALFWGGES